MQSDRTDRREEVGGIETHREVKKSKLREKERQQEQQTE